MNVSVLQENLLKALTRTGRIISARPQLPVLQNVLLVTEENRLRVAATNLETTETVWTGAKIEKEGGISVSSRLLTELVLSLPQDTVRLIIQNGSLNISCSGTSATMPGLAPGEFPPLPKIKPAKAAKLPKNTLVSALAAALFAAATDEGRPLLTGVKIKKENEGVVVVAATDGYRLSVKHLSLPLKDDLDLVLPARALAEVVRVSQEEKETDEIVFSQTDEGQLGFVVGDTEITTRVIDGEYPDFQKIIPTKFTTRALIDKEGFVRAVKSAAIFARDNANIVRFHLENQSLVVSASAANVGQNQVDLGVKIDGEGGDIAFNSRFLLEFLANFSQDELLFEMTGSLNPGVFKPVADDSYLHIIMPVRVAPG